MPGQNNEAASLHKVKIGHPYAVVVDSVSFSFMFLLIKDTFVQVAR